MPEKNAEKEFLTVKEAAAFIKVSIARLYQMKATIKDLPFHKVGEKLLFEKHELSEWVMKR